MLTKRHSVLESSLLELARAEQPTDLLPGETLAHPPALAIPGLDATPPLKGLAAARPEAVMPSDKVTLKLIAATGATDAVVEGLGELGCEVLSKGPQVILANVPPARLLALSELPGLKRAEQARRMQLRLDEARGPVTGADTAHATHPTLRGQGVVVGVVDSGTDWRHNDFRNADGTTRLDMFLHAVNDPSTGSDTFSEFSASDLNAALSAGANVPDGDPHGHGTHCASIAAGNGRAGGAQFHGLAPQATLMGVRSDTLHDTHIIEGIRRIFDRAGDRPAVVNLSLGGHIGPHDGTAAIENVIQQETGPGRIVVVAAGNEAEDRIHFDGQLVEGQDLDIEFTIRDSLQFLDIWIPRGDEVDISVIDADGVETIPDGSVQQTNAGAFRADLREDQLNRDINLSFAVAASRLGRRWRLRLHAHKVRVGTVHAWGQTDDFAFSRDIFMSQTSSRFSIGMPATEERAISVASFVSRAGILPGDAALPDLAVGQISPFSSHGPARHGAQRPDIAAPGQHIVAALAGGSQMATDARYAARRLPGGQYISIQGTSMATPFVTGVIALMLQQEPGLAPEDIQLRLRATAQRDADTGPVWNAGFGYGKIDVEALLNYPLGV
ncbi:S8 family serine peptidase [Ruegeria sp. SCP11]|uniref:S8 family serine peptidase n=1 Tax=Ruegeria sp. SCP11 TaxID=3141378 RepID=UPI0033359C68